MTRVVRYLWAACAAASLVLGAGACALWARSYSVEDGVGWQGTEAARVVRTPAGHVVVWLDRPDRSGGSGPTGRAWASSSDVLPLPPATVPANWWRRQLARPTAF